METQNIIKDIKYAFHEFENAVSKIDQEQFNKVPFEGSWTAGQLLSHVIISLSGFVEMLNGPVINTDREPDKLLPVLEIDFADFSIRMESPEFVIPEDKYYYKETLLSSLDHFTSKLKEAVRELDLTKTCTLFELPVYGALTRLESVYFVINHTKRHTRQLQNIGRKLSLPEKKM